MRGVGGLIVRVGRWVPWCSLSHQTLCCNKNTSMRQKLEQLLNGRHYGYTYAYQGCVCVCMGGGKKQKLIVFDTFLPLFIVNQ